MGTNLGKGGRKKIGAHHGGKKRFMPAKGTKARGILLLCMRPQGATCYEIRELWEDKKERFGHVLNRLWDDYGYDIRKIGHGWNAPYVLVGKSLDRFNKYKTLRCPEEIERLLRGK